MRYIPLKVDKNEIRVLKFLDVQGPASDNSLIHCSIENVPLEDVRKVQPFHEQFPHQEDLIWWDSFTGYVDLRDSNLEQTTLHHTLKQRIAETHNQTNAFRYSWGDYEALSYTWGDGDDARIDLDGKLLPVSRSLEEALRALRNLPETRLGMKYWVDFLCIDQNDVCERNHQVKRMRDVYSRARGVVVWLGRQEETDRVAVQLMRNLCRNSDARFSPRPSKGILPNEWHAIHAFTTKPYWNRSWIIQELAMNHNSTLILCGNSRLTRRMIRMGAMYCQQISRVSEVRSYRLPTCADPDAWARADRVIRLMNITFNPSLEGATGELLHLVRRADATDKKDKIYGILGLLDTSMTSAITPDYAFSVQKVYTNFMMTLIKATNTIEQVIFGGITIGEDWCSWVPDWRQPFDRHHFRQLSCRQAGGNIPAKIRFFSQRGNDCLVCDGYKVDTIDGVGSRPDAGHGINQSCYASNRYGDKLSEAVWRTLLVDHASFREKPSLLDVPWARHSSKKPNLPLSDLPNMNYFQRFLDFQAANKGFRLGGSRFKDFFPPSNSRNINLTGIKLQARIAVLSLTGRTLITTTTGYIGLAPQSVLPGDVVAVPFGCGFPMVLRPHGDFYKVVGECYVHGLMDGEVLKLESDDNVSQQEFILC